MPQQLLFCIVTSLLRNHERSTKDYQMPKENAHWTWKQEVQAQLLAV